MSGDSPSPVIFDLDGTLIATRRLYLESFADALEPVLGHRPDHDQMMALRPRAELRFLREVGGDEAHEGVMERFYEAYARRHARDFEGVYPGVPELLAGLGESGIPTGLVTGKSRRSWEISRPHLPTGITALRALVFDDDVPAPKPDPTGIQIALKSLNSLDSLDSLGSLRPAPQPERPGQLPKPGLYVGDTSSDLEAAQAAGLTPVAVLWSKRPEERAPFSHMATRLGGVAMESPGELLRWVRGARG